MSGDADLFITGAGEVKIRQRLTLVALGKAPADRALRVGPAARRPHPQLADRSGDCHQRPRIAWVGPAGTYRGEVAERHHFPDLAAVPGFGEVHKHIESTHLTPEYEAALVMPRGNTWTCEASHEFSNIDGRAISNSGASPAPPVRR